jgi:uncharacterized protein (TIGR00369 family)
MNRLPFADLLGIEIVDASPDRVTGRMLVREELCTRPAVLRGGAAMAFADTLGALATVLNLPEGGSTTTIESKTNFLRSAPAGQPCLPNAHRFIAANGPWSGKPASLPLRDVWWR